MSTGKLDPGIIYTCESCEHDIEGCTCPIQMDVNGKLLGVKELEERVHVLEEQVRFLLKECSKIKFSCFED